VALLGHPVSVFNTNSDERPFSDAALTKATEEIILYLRLTFEEGQMRRYNGSLARTKLRKTDQVS
jgi:hypothetical protein